LARARTTIPTKPDDARAQRSIDALQSAFLALLEYRSFDLISIKDITEAAGISYPTFFRRFASKEELLEHIATEEVRRLLSLGEAAMARGEFEHSAADMCDYVQGRRKLWATLLNGGAASAMRQEFMRVAKEIADARPRSNPWIPLELAVPFVTSGIFEIFAWWMRQPEDYPLGNVVKLFNALIVDTTGRRRDISLS
jgi:AcrR family transcriptional regulator